MTATACRRAVLMRICDAVGFTGSGETLSKGGIPVFLLLCLKKEEARGREA
jgi:hypothetical protein